MITEKEIQRKIEAFYIRYNFNESWRVLNCSKENIKSNNGIIIITLNPAWRKGTDYTNQEKFSYECGFSFLAENAQSKVQPQLKKFLKELHSKIYTTKSLDKFVNNVLVGYFIPVRSNSFKNLQNKKEAINLGKEIWNPILKENMNTLKLLVVIDKTTMKSVLEILSTFGFIEIEKVSFLTGWGDYKADIMRFKFNGKTITLLRLPHLGRFQIFGRSISVNHIKKLVKESVKYF